MLELWEHKLVNVNRKTSASHANRHEVNSSPLKTKSDPNMIRTPIPHIYIRRPAGVGSTLRVYRAKGYEDQEPPKDGWMLGRSRDPSRKAPYSGWAFPSQSH